MIWGSMPNKGHGGMVIVTSIVNTEVYIQILDSSLILSIENMFDDKEVIFQNNKKSSHIAKKFKAFL